MENQQASRGWKRKGRGDVHTMVVKVGMKKEQGQKLTKKKKKRMEMIRLRRKTEEKEEKKCQQARSYNIE